MSLILFVLLGSVAMLVGFGYAARGFTIIKTMREQGQSEPFGFGRAFVVHVQSKTRRAVFFSILLSFPFMTFYMWELIFEPESLGSAFLMSLPWLILMLFLALTLPFRIESIDRVKLVPQQDDME